MTIDTNASPQIETGTWVFDKAHTKIGFIAKHLMVSKVRGHFELFDGEIVIADDLSDSTIEVTIDPTSITTGAADRDDHLRSADFFEVQTHPEMKFVSTEIIRNGDDWRVTGDLTIRDTTRPVSLEVTHEGTATDPWGKDHVGFSARATINREDWGITWNAPLEGGGWLVSKEISLDIEGQLVRP